MRRFSTGLAAAATGLLLLLAQSVAAQAQACAARPALPAFAITLPKPAAVVGQPFALDWAAGTKPATPTYLVILAPDTVRFDGRGFFALTSGAPGPYGMKFGANRSRAVIPLHTAFSDVAGTVSVLFHDAQETALEWAVVQADACGEFVSARAAGKLAVDVLPGPPRLIGRDEFAARRPDTVIDPKRGPFQARVYDDAVEVADRGTGEIVLQTTGESPVFSPTGRFLVVETGEERMVDIFDLVAGRRIATFILLEGLYWSHEDSFVYADGSLYGQMRVLGTLVGAGEDIAAQTWQDLAETFARQDGDPPASGELSPGDGNPSAMTGADVWSANVSVESGAAIFLNTDANFADRIEDDFTDGLELGGRVLDLGRARPMLKFKDRADLEAALASDFALPDVQLHGWDSGHGLTRTNDFGYVVEEDYEEEDASVADGDQSADESNEASADEEAEPVDGYRENFVFEDASTQDEVESTIVAEVTADASDSIMRSAVSIAGIPAGGRFVAGDATDLLPQRAIANLRSGEDDGALKAITDRLRPLYGKSAMRWLFASDEIAYETAPFPDPAVAPEPDALDWIDLAHEGRDTWNWKLAGSEFWLTQTVASTHRGHHFNFSMLRLRDGRLDRVDPLQGLAGPDDAGADVSLVETGDIRGELASVFDKASFVGVAGERYLLIATKPVVRLIAFDLISLQPACSIAAPTDAADVERIEFSRDTRHLFQFNRNGQVSIYDCKSGARVLSGLVADNELVVMDDRGYFDGSEDAAAYVELKIPGLAGRHVLSQFASKLRRPGLLRDVLSGKRRDEPAAALAPPSGLVSATSGKGGLQVTAASTTGLRAVEIFADGRLMLRRDLDGNAAVASIAAADLPGAGFATVVVSDADGLTSAPVSVMLGDEQRKSNGRLVGMLVGVDDYPGIANANLEFAVADARRVAAAAEGSKLYSSTQLAVLTDVEATSAAILGRLDALVATANEDDTILFSFAGHGLVGANGGLRLGLSETKSANIEQTSLDFAAVVARLSKARAKVVVLLDACHSGVSGTEANDAGVRQLVTGSGAGIVVLAASKGRQLSEETAALGGGRFSVALAGSMTGGRAEADLDGNGALSVLELYRAVKTNVAASTDNRQIPWLSRNQIFGDFDIF